jgi:hypothetical protein
VKGRSTGGTSSAGPKTTSLDNQLEVLRTRNGAEAALLLGDWGSPAAATGDRFGIDLPVFASLATIQCEATTDLASLVGGVEFRALVQQGGETTISLSRGRSMVVAMVHRGAVPPDRIVPQIATGVEELERNLVDGGAGTSGNRLLHPEWTHETAKLIDRIFSDEA